VRFVSGHGDQGPAHPRRDDDGGERDGDERDDQRRAVAIEQRGDAATTARCARSSTRIAGKWSLLTIALLDGRVRRFTELQRMIDGISQRMLSVTLRQLERDGLVKRTVPPVVPLRVDYELTELGSTLLATTQAIVAWTEEHQAEVAAARSAYDARVAEEPVLA
jgi:DNA-binding HxlR family transcriptional regulator